MASTSFIIKVKEVSKLMTFGNNFRKIEIIGEEIRADNFTNILKVQATNEEADQMDGLPVGSIVSMKCEIRGKEWNKDGKDYIFTNLDIVEFNVTQTPRQQERKPMKPAEPAASLKAKDMDESTLFPDLPEQSYKDKYPEKFEPTDDNHDLPF